MPLNQAFGFREVLREIVLRSFQCLRELATQLSLENHDLMVTVWATAHAVISQITRLFESEFRGSIRKDERQLQVNSNGVQNGDDRSFKS